MSVVHFAEEGGEGGGGAADAPVLGVDLQGVMDHKGEDGLNFFDDSHKESLKIWGSDDPTKAKFRDADGKIHVPKLTKAYLDLQRQQGKQLKPLADDASERDRADYRATLGKMLNVPDTAEGYEILTDKLPDGAKVDEALINKLKLGSHKHNVSPEGVQFMFDLNNERITAEAAAHVKSVTDQNSENETHMKAKLGVEDYAASTALLEQFASDFTADDAELDEFIKSFQSTLFVGGSKTKVILSRMLAEAAQKLKGTSRVIPSEGQHVTDDRSLGKKEFPNSPEMH